MPKIVSGGGITSNKYVTSKSGQKVEPRSTAISPAGVSQQNVSTNFRRENVEVGRGYTPENMPATGMLGKFNAASQGPGSGRTIYRSGGQSLYGANAPNAVNRAPDPPAPKPGRDILSGYGPERRR